jgi:hypothetical protein
VTLPGIQFTSSQEFRILRARDVLGLPGTSTEESRIFRFPPRNKVELGFCSNEAKKVL